MSGWIDTGRHLLSRHPCVQLGIHDRCRTVYTTAATASWSSLLHPIPAKPLCSYSTVVSRRDTYSTANVCQPRYLILPFTSSRVGQTGTSLNLCAATKGSGDRRVRHSNGLEHATAVVTRADIRRPELDFVRATNKTPAERAGLNSGAGERERVVGTDGGLHPVITAGVYGHEADGRKCGFALIRSKRCGVGRAGRGHGEQLAPVPDLEHRRRRAVEFCPPNVGTADGEVKV